MTTASNLATTNGHASPNAAVPQVPAPLGNSGRAFVKSVLSGDGVVLRGRPVNGPPAEKLLSFANVVAPRMGTVSDPSKEELGAFESREFLRKLLIGKEVSFKVEYTTTTNSRDFGSLMLPPPGVDGETNVTRLLVKSGWVKVKSTEGKRTLSDEQTALMELEAAAQAGGLGLWSPKLVPRTISYSIADARAFFETHKGKPLTALVDQVRDANTIRIAVVFPESLHQYININLTGIKAPVYRSNVPNVEDLIEPYSQEAKYFVESRLLQREVTAYLEGVNSNGVFVASLVHKVGGSIAEALVAEGYASVVSWQTSLLTNGVDKLKAAELKAKEKKLRVWKNFVEKANPNAANKATSLVDYEAIVTRIMSTDSIMVIPVGKPSSQERRVFFSSLRAPPKSKEGETAESGLSHEAREFLRQKLIGKTVRVVVDYVKPKENNYDERCCASVTLNDTNIAETLISRGYATALRHRKDDDDRASNYDALLLAEDNALKALKGLHSGKDFPTLKIVDASESAAKAKSFLSGLQRNKTVGGVVEFASSGSRFKIWIPSQNIKITLVLGGVRTPKAARQNASGGKDAEKGEPFGQEALDLANRRSLQRDVEISVESIDKAGGFIGTLFVPSLQKSGGSAISTVPGLSGKNSSTALDNFAVLLLENGFATVHDFSASQSPYGAQFYAAEKRAQEARLGVWSLRDPEEEARAKAAASAAVNGSEDFAETTSEVYVSEIGDGGVIHIQTVGSELSRLEKVMSDFAIYYKNHQLPLAQGPKVNDYVAAKFSADDQWYRARVREYNAASKTYLVTFIDYGNSESLPISRLRALAPEFSATVLPPQSKEARLAFLTVPAISEEGGEAAYERLTDETEGRKLVARILGRPTGASPVHVLLSASSSGVINDNLNLSLVADGLAYLDRSVTRLYDEAVKTGSSAKSLKQGVLASLVAAQESARKGRQGLWRYGDFRNDE
ncbi:hypothetical protein HDU84_000516 [Entophlyctis sp. JEL0112]|nr:hypothetical protein HDU84_000516 [Entophlyctis sp. JEL0112]